MSNSSRTQVRYLAESTWGTTPASAMTELNVTSESLGQNTNQVISEYIRSDRQNADVARASITAGGDIGIELQYAGYDDLFEGAFMNDFTSDISETITTIDAAAGDNSFNDSGTGFVTAGIEQGMWINVSGFTDSANNGYFKVESVTAGKIVVSGGTLVTEAAGDTVTYKNDGFLEQGTTSKSFTLEKEFADITEFVSFTGCRVGSLNLNIAPGSIINGSISFQGKQAAAAGATVGTGAANAASTNSVMNAVDHVSNVREGGSAATFDITNISFTLDNALRDQPAVGSVANIGIGEGTVQVTGNIELYFADRTEYEKHLNDTESSLSFITTDSAGNAYIWEFPRIKYGAGNPVAGGKDQDVLVSLDFTAFRDATDGNTITLTRFDA